MCSFNSEESAKLFLRGRVETGEEVAPKLAEGPEARWWRQGEGDGVSLQEWQLLPQRQDTNWRRRSIGSKGAGGAVANPDGHNRAGLHASRKHLAEATRALLHKEGGRTCRRPSCRERSSSLHHLCLGCRR